MKHCKTAVSILLSVLLAASMVSFTIFNQELDSYSMYVNNQIVGVVKYAAKGLAFYDSAMNKIREQYPEGSSIESEVYFKETKGSSDKLSSEAQIAKAIGQVVEVQSPAYAIRINGNTICHVQTFKETEQLTAAIKKPFIDEIASSGAQLQKIGFNEDVQFTPVTVNFKEIVSVQEALKLLQQNIEGVVEHIATSNDTFWDLAEANNMDVDEIQALNPEINPRKIKKGDVIVLSLEKKLLNIITEETQTYEDAIPFEVEERDDDTLLRGKTKKVQEGRNGNKEVQVLIVRENSRETKREIIKETVLNEPVNEIVAVGTKKPAPTPKPTKAPSRSGSSKATPAPSKKPDYGSVTGEDIVAYAKTLLGKKYVRGEVGPNSFDCSGFTVYVYRHFGIRIQRMEQHTIGKGVAKEDMIPGDIVCFRDPGHVGIYVGDGNMIHASSTEGKVVIKSIYTTNYIRRYRASRRIIY